MQSPYEMENPEAVDPIEHANQMEILAEKREDFMRKYLKRAWPVRVTRIIGIIQLLIALAILGVDLPIILMFAPRWQIFAGIWTFILVFIACVSTLHSTRRMTWPKLKWAAALNILAGIAGAIMLAFNILYLVNPNICLVAGGCNYLWYTYSAANSYYVGEVILGIALLLSVFIFLILFIKYGIGGTTLFENIQKGWTSSSFESILPSSDKHPSQAAPAAGVGVYAAQRGLPQGYIPQRPMGPAMVRYPNGAMMRPPGMMMRPPGGMMMQGPYGPAMMPPPQMQPNYRQPGPQQATTVRRQN